MEPGLAAPGRRSRPGAQHGGAWRAARGHARARLDPLGRWGNPNQQFVGDPDGHISSHTGYGVYAGPIARAARQRGATVLAAGGGIVPSTVYADVLAGHPVVAWVTNDYRRGNPRTWQAWDGSTIQYASNEHAVLVVGVTPGAVLINDPVAGQVWRTRSDFEAAYATFGDMAVVVG